MRKGLRWGGLLTVALCAAGCANVAVKKVPVAAHAAGTDAPITGVRYYLSRPYVVVKNRVLLSTESIPAKLVAIPPDKPGGKPSYYLVSLATFGKEQTHRVFNLQGADVNEKWEDLKKKGAPPGMNGE